jgi:hypothetical protein
LKNYTECLISPFLIVFFNKIHRDSPTPCHRLVNAMPRARSVVRPCEILCGRSDLGADLVFALRFTLPTAVMLHIHSYFYHRRHIVSILRASLSNKLKRISFVAFVESREIMSWGMEGYFQGPHAASVPRVGEPWCSLWFEGNHTVSCIARQSSRLSTRNSRTKVYSSLLGNSLRASGLAR